MDQRVIDLKSTTFPWRRLTRRQIADIQETVQLLPNDSRNELGRTIRGHPGWTVAKGDCRVGACLGMPGRWRASASWSRRRGGRKASAT